MCFYSQITNYKGNYARDTSISPVSRSYSSTRWSSRRVPGNPSRSLARTDYFPIDRLICELIVQLSVSIYTCSTVWCTATSVFEPCKATFVLVARYRRRVYVYVRAYVLEAARYASDNGVASRQRKSSHEKCTPSPSKPPDNKVEREENRLFSFLFHLSPPLSLSLSLCLSLFAQLGPNCRDHRCAPVHEIFRLPSSFGEGRKPCDSFLESPSFLAKILIDRN